MNNKIKEIMEKTCWESLSYCCSLAKPCKLRDTAMKELNMTSKEYEELKKQFDESIISNRRKND